MKKVEDLFTGEYDKQDIELYYESGKKQVHLYRHDIVESNQYNPLHDKYVLFSNKAALCEMLTKDGLIAFYLTNGEARCQNEGDPIIGFRVIV